MPPLTTLCFRQVVYLLVFLGILTVTTTATAANREVRRYDRQGRYQGKAVSNDRGEMRSYDRQGRYLGKSVRQGDTVRRYDRQGRYQGKRVSGR